MHSSLLSNGRLVYVCKVVAWLVWNFFMFLYVGLWMCFCLLVTCIFACLLSYFVIDACLYAYFLLVMR